jgi:hypothetical protein
VAKPKTPDEFLASLGKPQLALARKARAAVRKAAPRAEETVRMGLLFFEVAGPICFLQPHAKHLNLGFWRGAHLPDPRGLLEGTGRHMRHLKLRGPEDVDAAAIGALVRAGAKLNREVPYT